MPLDRISTDLMRAVGFLGRLPVPGRAFEGDDGKVGRLAALFPLAGLVIALGPALLILVLDWLDVAAALTALLALAVLALATGALHEDGLADCADGFGAGGARERILDILKDSHIGAYGALALIFSIGLRAVCWTVLIATASPLSAALAFLGTAALSRGLMVWHWSALPGARNGGLAFTAGNPPSSAVTTALVSGFLFALIGTWALAGFLAVVFAGLTAAGGVYAWTRFIDARIDGHTGDTIGAAQQIAELAFLIALVVAL